MARGVVSSTLMLWTTLAVGCGGQSGRDSEAPNAGGTSGTAGSASTAGSGGTVIPPIGGTDAAGGADLGGSGGADPSLLSPCLQPIESGSCQALIPRVAFDPETLECVEFTYGGCGANANNFETFAECSEACEERYSSCSTTDRAAHCPCTKREDCASGHCSSASYEEGNGCFAYPIGYCRRFGEGSCVCPLEGGRPICGV